MMSGGDISSGSYFPSIGQTALRRLEVRGAIDSFLSPISILPLTHFKPDRPLAPTDWGG